MKTLSWKKYFSFFYNLLNIVRFMRSIDKKLLFANSIFKNSWQQINKKKSTFLSCPTCKKMGLMGGI